MNFGEIGPSEELRGLAQTAGLPAPAGKREVFEEMAHARATRFFYDPRVIVATSVEIHGTTLHVNAAGMHYE